MVMVVAPSADQMNACVSKGHTQLQSVREQVRWRGECGRAEAPSSIELVEHSTCKFGSQTGDLPALHLGAEPCEQQTGTASEPLSAARN